MRNIPFLDIFQTVLKAGFCLSLYSSLLSTAATVCHVIPEVMALIHIRAAVNHLHTPLLCHRSGPLLGSHVPCDVGLNQGPLP